MTKERLSREAIAMRIAREFFDGAVVNLGIGIPTLCSSFVPEGCRSPIIPKTELWDLAEWSPKKKRLTLPILI